VLAYFAASHDEDLLNWRDPGDDLPPLRLNIPARDYVLDADRADERQVQQFFAQPPVERVQRLYSIDEVKRSARVRDMVRRLDIRLGSVGMEIRNLSGGNQQKVLIGRALAVEPKILIFDEPTRGLDIGAKQEIYAFIEQLGSQGVAILLVSS